MVGPTFAPLLFGSAYDGTGTALMIFGPVTILTFGTTLFATVAMGNRTAPSPRCCSSRKRSPFRSTSSSCPGPLIATTMVRLEERSPTW